MGGVRQPLAIDNFVEFLALGEDGLLLAYILLSWSNELQCAVTVEVVSDWTMEVPH